MKKQFIKYAMLSLVLLLTACGKNAEYAKVIPADVNLVATFDCQRILEESDLMASQENESQKQFFESIKKNLSAGETELFEQLMANPNELGLDWTQKAFAFVQTESEIGAMLFPVVDAQKLKTALITFSGSKIRGRKFTDEEGYLRINVKYSNYRDPNINLQSTTQELGFSVSKAPVTITSKIP